MSSFFVVKMSGVIDEELKVSHEDLASQVEAVLELSKESKLWRTMKGINEFELSLADWSYTPIIQSGGVYDLRSSAVSSSKALKSGVILASLSVRYKSYCANIGRTFLIDPHKVWPTCDECASARLTNSLIHSRKKLPTHWWFLSRLRRLPCCETVRSQATSTMEYSLVSLRSDQS